MEEKQTPTPDIDTQIQEAVTLANTANDERRNADEIALFAQRARTHIEIDDESSPESQEVTVGHKPSGKKIAAGVIAGAVAIGGSIAAAEPIGNAIDQHFTQVEENNKRWSEEAENARRLQEQDLDSGKITIEVNNPPEDSDQ